MTAPRDRERWARLAHETKGRFAGLYLDDGMGPKIAVADLLDAVDAALTSRPVGGEEELAEAINARLAGLFRGLFFDHAEKMWGQPLGPSSRGIDIGAEASRVAIERVGRVEPDYEAAAKAIYDPWDHGKLSTMSGAMDAVLAVDAALKGAARGDKT